MNRFFLSLFFVLCLLTSHTVVSQSNGLVNIPSLLNSLGLTTFANIVSLSGVLQTLQSPGPFTVFAPSNAAFNSIPSATLANLLNSPQLLTQIVLNQVVNGNHLSSSLSNGLVLTSLQGSPLVISNSTDGGLRIGNSLVTSVDNLASNGIVNVISNVLTPSTWHFP